MSSDKVAVIGLGYVGLPVACVLAEAGFDTIGIDLDSARIKIINSGKSPIEGNEPGLAELIHKVVSSGKLHASADYQDVAVANALFVCLDSPIGEDHHPDLTVGYNRCVVRYSTHSVGGLSENDFICAAKGDALLA